MFSFILATIFPQVCDYVIHCPDESDESFCKFDPCPSNSVTCDSGQCVRVDQLCDSSTPHCDDLSDELMTSCGLRDTFTWNLYPLPYMIGRAPLLKPQFLTDISQCPDTHFTCPEGLCLPFFLRCNGVSDCHNHLDEEQCDDYICPGYYRCWKSKVGVYLS